MRSLVRIAGLATVLILLIPSVAVAHSITYDTSIGIHRSPKGTVDRGTTVRFHGGLHSPKAACESGSVVKLVKVGTGVVATTTTGSLGHYHFSRTVRSTATWKVRFPGEVLTAVHPHNHVCGSSVSRKLLVTVS